MAVMKCLSCGSEKDTGGESIYLHSGEYDHLIQSEPIPMLLVVECEGDDGSRMAILCHDCWHRLGENTQGIDMWISDRCWETLNPVIPFADLPEPKDLSHLPDSERRRTKWNASTYLPGV